jgi:hypothetical protein
VSTRAEQRRVTKAHEKAARAKKTTKGGILTKLREELKDLQNKQLELERQLYQASHQFQMALQMLEGVHQRHCALVMVMRDDLHLFTQEEMDWAVAIYEHQMKAAIEQRVERSKKVQGADPKTIHQVEREIAWAQEKQRREAAAAP